MEMIPAKVEGVRRNFTASSAFLYHVCLIDEAEQRLLVLGIERHEALPIVAALNQLTLPRKPAICLMAETLVALGYKLEAVKIQSHSMLPPNYNICKCQLCFRNGERTQEQHQLLCPGDVIGLALFMDASISVSRDLFQQIGITLAEEQTPEIVFAQYLLRREGITLPAGKQLRLGFSKTPLRDALVKEFKAALQGKAPNFPEEEMDQRKKEYLSFIFGDEL